MSDLSSVTKRMMVIGIFAVCMLGMYKDPVVGKELALITIGGVLGLLKGGE